MQTIVAAVLLAAIAVAVNAAADYELNSTDVRRRPLGAAASTPAAQLIQQIATTLAPSLNNVVVNGTTKTEKPKKVALENHPVLRAIHCTVCYGLPGPKPPVRSAKSPILSEENSVVINDGLNDITFRVVQAGAGVAGVATKSIVSTVTGTLSAVTQFIFTHPILSPFAPKLNTTNPAQIKAVIGDAKARLYRNVFRHAASLMMPIGMGEVTGNRALQTGDNMDKLCAKLTEAEQEALDFRRISKRGLDDNGKHDPDEVSDGEDDDDDVPTWY